MDFIMKIAFIGLGNMGGGMAANLARAGHTVRAFDLAEDALARAREHGCETFATVREAVDGVDAMVSMLPNGAIVDAVFRADVIGHAPASALLLDCSTIDVDTARKVAAAAEAAGHAGASGAGQAAKICNNMILGATMVATCEAFALALKLGLDPQTFYDISSKASGQSWSMTSYCPLPGVGPQSPADNDYQGGFAAALMLKDLKLALAAADSAGAKVPMGTRAEELYAAFAAAGNGGKDFSAIIKTL